VGAALIEEASVRLRRERMVVRIVRGRKRLNGTGGFFD
jgi:hypothetical protein